MRVLVRLIVAVIGLTLAGVAVPHGTGALEAPEIVTESDESAPHLVAASAEDIVLDALGEDGLLPVVGEEPPADNEAPDDPDARWLDLDGLGVSPGSFHVALAMTAVGGQLQGVEHGLFRPPRS